MEVTCWCGSPAELKSNSVIYKKEYGNGKAWICSRFPSCNSYVGTHPDGKPLGTLEDSETRKIRQRAHRLFDQLWKGEKARMTRSQAYKWLQHELGITRAQAHIGQFDRYFCQRTIELLYKMGIK